MNLLTQLCLAYVIGLAIHLLSQAKASSSSGANGLSGMRQWFALTWVTVLIRTLALTAAFGWWITDPASFNTVLSTVFLGTMQALPVKWGVALVFGYMGDSMLDKFSTFIPGLKIDIPEISPPNGK